MKKKLYPLLPVLVLAALLLPVLLLPKQTKPEESAISPDLPLGRSLPGWVGEKRQEDEAERSILAPDTRFSKACYAQLNPLSGKLYGPPVTVSIVYSGNDMNSSIHRPERCLPAQGHQNLHGETCEVPLEDGRKLRFMRLVSYISLGEGKGGRVQHINYYVFVGRNCITDSHMRRTLQDMWDRVMRGMVQRWAYLQVGSYWGGETSFSEKDADEAIRRLISQVMPRIMLRYPGEE